MKIIMATESSPIASRRSLRERARERERERERERDGGGEVVGTENIGVMDRQNNRMKNTEIVRTTIKTYSFQ